MKRGSFLSRLLALLILFAPFAVGFYMIATPFFARWQAEGKTIRQFRVQNAALEWQEARLDRIENMADRWQEFAKTDSSGLVQSDLETASETTLAWLKQRLEQLDGSLVEANISENSVVDKLETKSLDIRAELPAQKLFEILTDIEAYLPLLIIDQMDAESLGQSAEHDPRLALTLQLRIYRLMEERP